MNIYDFLWVISSFIVVGTWIFFYFQTRKKIFIVIAIITLIANIYSFKNYGLSLTSFKNIF